MSRSSIILCYASVLLILALTPVSTLSILSAAQYDTGKSALGENLFRSYCRSCHGATGQGNGPVSEHLKTPPTDLTQLQRSNGGEFPTERVRKVIDGRNKLGAHGRDMPVWGEAFLVSKEAQNEEEVTERIDELVHFVASIQEH